MDLIEVFEEEPARPRKDTSYREVFRLWGKYPKNWDMNRTQIQAAKNLMEEQGISTVQKILKWYNNHKDDPYCPLITTPYDLDSKLPKLKAYRDRI